PVAFGRDRRSARRQATRARRRMGHVGPAAFVEGAGRPGTTTAWTRKSRAALGRSWWASGRVGQPSRDPGGENPKGTGRSRAAVGGRLITRPGRESARRLRRA